IKPLDLLDDFVSGHAQSVLRRARTSNRIRTARRSALRAQIKSYFLRSIKISQRFTLSNFRMPCSTHGSCFNFSRTSFSSSALKINKEPPSSTKGPPIKMKPSSTSLSMNAAGSSQKGCSRVPMEKSRLGPAEEIARNTFFMTGELQTSVPIVNLSAPLRSAAQLSRAYDGSRPVVAPRSLGLVAEPASQLV